jgi:signal transduction histidine kinase
MNILGNAIDALEDAIQQRLEADRVDNHADGTASTDSFTPQIHIHTALTSDQQVSIRIADNGIGIPEQVKSRLFDPFFTTKPIGKGTGMGLSISYQIVTERHGGSLTCESVPNQGTEFHILIPLSS